MKNSNFIFRMSGIFSLTIQTNHINNILLSRCLLVLNTTPFIFINITIDYLYHQDYIASNR